MFTFLTRAHKIEVEREYRKRLLAVASGLFFVLMFLAAVLTVPSYVTLSIKKANAGLTAKSIAPSADVADFEARASDISAKSAALSKALEEKSLLSVLERV